LGKEKDKAVERSTPSSPKAVSSSFGKLAIISFSSAASWAKEENSETKTNISAATAADQMMTDLKCILNSCWKMFIRMVITYS
jgi:hypothetical protein